MELVCPGALLSLSIPDLRAVQPGYGQPVQGFDLSYTTARSRVCWQAVLQPTGKSLNSVFSQKWLTARQAGVKKCNFSDFRWQQLIA